MEYLYILIPSVVIVVGGIIHIEVSIAIVKTDIKWIKKQLNNPPTSSGLP